MDLGIISTRYAKALLRFAAENGEDEQVYAEMQTLSRTFESVPRLQQAVLNPVLTTAQCERLLVCAACGENEPSASTRKFISLVVRKGRGSVMQLIANSYGTLYRQAHHLVSAKLTVPFAAGDAVIAKMRRMVEAKAKGDILFEVKVNPDIEGGFILEYDTYRLDASVRSQLAKLRRQLAQ